jgi:hypothetical protein
MSQFIFSEKRLTAVVRKAVDDAFKAGQNSDSAAHPDWEYIPSILELARFLGCSYEIAKKIRKEGRIKGSISGGKVRFYIPDVLHAIDHDPVVKDLFNRVCDHFKAPVPQLPKIPRPATVESELFPGRFVLATIRYQGWRCYACFPEETYCDPEKVDDFVQEIIFRRHERHPFPILPIA